MYTIAEFTKLVTDPNERNNNEIVEAQKLADEVSKFHPAQVMVSVHKEDDNYFFNYCSVVLNDTPDIEIKYESYIKRYYLYARKIDRLKNVSHYDKEKAQDAVNSPKNMGVLSANKIKEHISYWQQMYDQLAELNKRNSEEIQAFKESISGLPVRWRNDGNSGTIVQNGIEFEFHIKDGHVSQKMQIHYSVSTNIENFKKLSAVKIDFQP